MKLNVQSSQTTYPIIIEEGVLHKLVEYIDVNKKTLLVSDSNIPASYKQCVKQQLTNVVYVEILSGETSKSMEVLTSLLETMCKHNFTRKDQIIALGGGVVSDLSGFAASIYMRGISYITIPTTVLAMCDASIGGKTAIDFMSHKNIVGSFYPPSCILMDMQTLQTLPKEEVQSGIAEIIKCAMIKDQYLFQQIKNKTISLQDMIIQAIYIKKEIVQEDEKEGGMRKLLNFGHTYGHAIESLSGCKHGYAVGIGMILAVENPSIKEELKEVLFAYGLPYTSDYKKSDLVEEILHDKKSEGDTIVFVCVDEIGKGYLKRRKLCDLQ